MTIFVLHFNMHQAVHAIQSNCLLMPLISMAMAMGSTKKFTPKSSYNAPQAFDHVLKTFHLLKHIQLIVLSLFFDWLKKSNKVSQSASTSSCAVVNPVSARAMYVQI